VSRQVSRLSLWLVFAPLSAFAAGPDSVSTTTAVPVAITFTEQPVKLARDTGLYSAGRGAALLPNDLITSGAGTVLLDVGGAAVAVGPASSVYLKNGELVLLSGWLKVGDSGARSLLLTTAGLQFDSAGISATVHAAPGMTELFAESAAVAVLPLPADKAARRTVVPREQFGVKRGMQALKLSARPPAAFLAGMPHAFLDPLVALHLKGAPVPPKRERPATFAELAPLLDEQPALRQQLQTRFAPPKPARAGTPPVQSSNNLF
jgi:hypothetical protein